MEKIGVWCGANKIIVRSGHCDGADWALITVEITATSLFQLMKCFIKETTYLHQRDKNFDTNRLARKYIWDSNKKYIEVSNLTFPIISRKRNLGN